MGLLSKLFSSGGEPPKYELDDGYKGLRQMALTTPPQALGIAPKSADEVWGVLMETGFPEGAATLVAMGDGAVSLYYSTGGGTIGLGDHPGPRQAADALLGTAQAFSRQAEPTKDFPLPHPDAVRFYLLTSSGPRTVEAKEDDLGNGRHRFSQLFYAAHHLLTAIRESQESGEGE